MGLEGHIIQRLPELFLADSKLGEVVIFLLSNGTSPLVEKCLLPLPEVNEKIHTILVENLTLLGKVPAFPLAVE